MTLEHFILFCGMGRLLDLSSCIKVMTFLPQSGHGRTQVTFSDMRMAQPYLGQHASFRTDLVLLVDLSILVEKSLVALSIQANSGKWDGYQMVVYPKKVKHSLLYQR